MKEKEKGEGETPPSPEQIREVAAKLEPIFHKGMEYSVQALEALAKAGLTPGDRHHLVGILMLAYGIGKLGANLTPKQLGGMAEMLAELADAIRASKSAEEKAEANRQALALTKRVGFFRDGGGGGKVH